MRSRKPHNGQQLGLFDQPLRRHNPAPPQIRAKVASDDILEARRCQSGAIKDEEFLRMCDYGPWRIVVFRKHEIRRQEQVVYWRATVPNAAEGYTYKFEGRRTYTWPWEYLIAALDAEHDAKKYLHQNGGGVQLRNEES